MLFTFPSWYLFTIGRQKYLALGGGPPSFPQDFTCPVVLKKPAEVSRLSSTGVSPSTLRLPSAVRLDTKFVTSWNPCRGSRRLLQPPRCNGCSLLHNAGLGFSLFARHYSGNLFSSSGYLDVSVPQVPPDYPMCSGSGVQAFPWTGFPIRISPAEMLDDSLPRLFVAIHVLLRLLAPRHPPYALSSLIHARRQKSNQLMLSSQRFTTTLFSC